MIKYKKMHLEDFMSYSENFAANIKELRRQSRLTQRGFAELLGYSEKTVSKWECGASIPPIDTLFEIANAFHTSIEALFKADIHYYLAIDGGGTKTALLLASSEGDTVRTHRATACNPVDVGIDAACDILKEAIYAVCRDVPFSQITLFAGIAGGTSAGMQQRLSEFFSKFGFAAYGNDSDNKNIIAEGLGDEDGITLILGTGICAYVQQGGECSRIGGWGYLIDDGGSGYNLGRDALNAYFTALDGTGEPTLLTEEVNKLYEGGEPEIMGYIYSEKKRAVASFAPAVYAAIERGDETARKILLRNMKEAARIADAALARFPRGSRVPLVLAGGLTSHGITIDYLRDSLSEPDRFDMKIMDREPVFGALELAKKIKRNEE